MLHKSLLLFIAVLFSSVSFSQDMAAATYRVYIHLDEIKLKQTTDTLISIEFYSGVDAEMNCSVAHSHLSRGILNDNTDDLNFEIFAMIAGIGSCSRQVKPPTIFLKFNIESGFSEENKTEYDKIIPIVFECAYSDAQITIDSLKLSDRLGIFDKEVVIAVDTEKNYRIIQKIDSDQDVDFSTLVKYEKYKIEN